MAPHLHDTLRRPGAPPHRARRPWLLGTALLGAALLGAALLGALLGGCPRFQERPVSFPAPKEQFLSVAGRRIHYVEQGNPTGPAVVFIHGFASSWVVWERLMKDLGSQYRVLALDLPGFGYSDKRAGDYSPQGLGDLVAAFLSARGIQRAHVVAHSWGSSVALALAFRHAARVQSLTLVGAWVYDEQLAPFQRWARARGLGEALFALFYKERVGDRMALAFHAPDRYVTHAVIQKVRAALDRPGAVRAALAATRKQRLHELEPYYWRIRAPALLLWGREDDVALVRFGERLARDLPRARLRVFARCGHFPMIEAYGASLDALTHHLEESR